MFSPHSNLVAQKNKCGMKKDLVSQQLIYLLSNPEQKETEFTAKNIPPYINLNKITFKLMR